MWAGCFCLLLTFRFSLSSKHIIMGKIVIYQIFTRLFGNSVSARIKNGTKNENGCGKMNFFDESVLGNIRKLGITHVWYTGIIRHATKTDYSSYGIPRQHPAVVKGNAGSPYAIADYYDVDPDLADDVDGRMNEFLSLVERTHNAGMKVVIDFVPNHVARQYRSVVKPKKVRDLGQDDDRNMGFSPKNNFYYCPGEAFAPYFDLKDGAEQPYEEYPAKATGNDCFTSHPGVCDWFETVKLNYGVDYCDAGGRSFHFVPKPDTWAKMLDILLFWCGKGIDGFRCDMAEMVPAEFWDWAIGQVKRAYPDVIFIGEVYNPSLYDRYIASGFDFLYDKVGMYDCLKGVIRHERAASDITYQWQNVGDKQGRMLYFLENHDEQRIASDYFAGCGERAFPGMIVCALMQRNPLMIYAGQEYGEKGMDDEGFSGKDGRTTIFDYWTVESLYSAYIDSRTQTKQQKSLYAEYVKLMNIVGHEKVVSDGSFFDLEYANIGRKDFDGNRQYAFLRKKDEDLLLVVANFSDEERVCSLLIPQHAFDCLGLKAENAEAVDLLNGGKQHFMLSPESPLTLTVGANNGVVYKIKI